MPRQARVDIAGGLYHVIARGNERREIFGDDADYKEFYARVKQCVAETRQKCLAWAFISKVTLLTLGCSLPVSPGGALLAGLLLSYFPGETPEPQLSAFLC